MATVWTFEEGTTQAPFIVASWSSVFTKLNWVTLNTAWDDRSSQSFIHTIILPIGSTKVRNWKKDSLNSPTTVIYNVSSFETQTMRVNVQVPSRIRSCDPMFWRLNIEFTESMQPSGSIILKTLNAYLCIRTFTYLIDDIYTHQNTVLWRHIRGCRYTYMNSRCQHQTPGEYRL
jgi:hypothetical protein